MRIILISIFLLLSFNTYSSKPKSIYSFYRILSPEKFHPFSNAQTKLFKEKGVKEVISTKNNLKSTYQINKNGYVQSIETVGLENGKETFFSKSFYLYNENNQVISIRSENESQAYYDTLAYDTIGRTIYYKTVVKPSSTVKKEDPHYNYSDVYILKSSNDNYVTLTDKRTQSIEIRLNNNNQIIQQTNNSAENFTDHEALIDSIYIQKINESSLIKKYYHQEQKGSAFRIGKIETFQDNQIQSIKSYQINSFNTADINYEIYTYDNSKLIRVESLPNYNHSNDLTLYTYHQCKCKGLKNNGFLKREGLLQKKISLHYSPDNTTISTEKYNYHFY